MRRAEKIIQKIKEANEIASIHNFDDGFFVFIFHCIDIGWEVGERVCFGEMRERAQQQ